MVESRIHELFSSDKTVYIFDVDGVLAKLEFGEYNHYYYNDEEWQKAIQNHNYYKDSLAIPTMKGFLKNKDKNRIFVATKILNEEEKKQKELFLERNYGIKPEHVYVVNKNEEKLNVIKKIQQLMPDLEDKYFVIIDDTIDVLNDVMDHSNYSTVHISSFLE